LLGITAKYFENRGDFSRFEPVNSGGKTDCSSSLGAQEFSSLFAVGMFCSWVIHVLVRGRGHSAGFFMIVKSLKYRLSAELLWA
jgi:hypothetical protein